MTKYGDKGEAVQALQTALLQLGYEHVKASGEFDVRTDEAVRHLQRSFGYDINGTGSDATWALIRQQLGYHWNQQRSPAPLVVLTRGATGEAVLDAQRKLQALGYGDVPLSGRFEVHTLEAVRHLQSAFGYVVDGTIGHAVRFLLAQQTGHGWDQKKSPLPLRELGPGTRGDDVTAAQRELVTLGFAEVSASGVYDAATEAAVRELQEAFGYTVNGVFSDAVRFLVRQQLAYGWRRKVKASAPEGDRWRRIDGLPFASTKVQFSPVRTQYYGHGAFMGATPSLLADAKWRRILGFLLPDVFDALSAKLAAGADVSALIPMMENNPVLAAYGTLKTAQSVGAGEHANHLVGLEWDIFVDTDLIEARAEATTPEAQSAVMDKVLDTALIAHGGAMDTVLESLGVSQYDEVRLTPKTEYGGVEMDSWLDLYGRSLALARADDFEASVAQMATEPRSPSQEGCMVNTFATPWSVERVVEEHQKATGRAMLSVVIDIKSINSTPEFLSALVQHLNRFGVHVAGIGSFLRDEIAGVSAVPQRLGSTVLSGPREVWFFHFAGDLQRACAEKRVPKGQHVLFNGASLIEPHGATPRERSYIPRISVIEGLDRLRKELGLHLGFYVQEGDCDAHAAGALSALLDAWPRTFELGFAWGGLRDAAGLVPDALPRTGHGSQALLMRIGKAHDWTD